ncbi:hypothetical protein K438DRAFT_1756212 [Mycena galopus ATCC 62051]|nr:hypothetical protein K438DRAFT_1756212 [Mycena galopus ATCC 62051]
MFLSAQHQLVSLSAAVIIPGEGVYSVSNLGNLPDEPTNVTQPLANQLLDVLQNYGLTKNFGVVGVHSHVALAPRQVMFQHGNSTFTHQEIEVYDDVKDTGVPYHNGYGLLPLDLGDTTFVVLAARSYLATAMAGNFLKVKNFTAGNASAISLSDVGTNDAPLFFTRGVGNSTAASDITILCELCGHGNLWTD